MINEGKPVVWLFLYIRYLSGPQTNEPSKAFKIMIKQSDGKCLCFCNCRPTHPASCASWALITDSKLLFTKKSHTAE